MKKPLNKKIKELTGNESLLKVKELLKERRKISIKDFEPGNLIFTSYNAKDKDQTFDRTPLILVLRVGAMHTLGLNFHWIPLSMRLFLIQAILKMNKANIRNNRPLVFSYKDLKPMLKSLGYAPCIRLYINKRISSLGVVISPDRLTEVAQLKTETFTGGKYSAEQLFAIAKKRNK